LSGPVFYAQRGNCKFFGQQTLGSESDWMSVEIRLPPQISGNLQKVPFMGYFTFVDLSLCASPRAMVKAGVEAIKPACSLDRCR
jgi:hypothetical protein